MGKIIAAALLACLTVAPRTPPTLADAEARLFTLYAAQTEAMKRNDVREMIRLSPEIDTETFEVMRLRRQRIEEIDRQLSTP